VTVCMCMCVQAPGGECMESEEVVQSIVTVGWMDGLGWVELD